MKAWTLLSKESWISLTDNDGFDLIALSVKLEILALRNLGYAVQIAAFLPLKRHLGWAGGKRKSDPHNSVQMGRASGNPVRKNISCLTATSIRLTVSLMRIAFRWILYSIHLWNAFDFGAARNPSGTQSKHLYRVCSTKWASMPRQKVLRHSAEGAVVTGPNYASMWNPPQTFLQFDNQSNC